MKPKFYVNDRLRKGTLSGSEDDSRNPEERLADGSITLGYTATTGTTPSGEYQVAISGEAFAPEALVIARADALSGTTFQVISETLAGASTLVVASGDVTGSPSNFVLAIPSGATPREVWRVQVTGPTSGTQVTIYESMLADLVELDRLPQVGISRVRIRQFTRTAIPGGQPFVKRDGPNLRRTGYSYILTSGTEIEEMRGLITALAGGEFFFHVDDLGAQYWAEVMGDGLDEADEAGVSSAGLTVQEVASD